MEWLGWHNDPWAAAPAASVMVQPSAYEGYSMVMIEALALGLPVVASRFGGVSGEAIIPGKNGWLFPVADVEALKQILQAIIDHPETLPGVEQVRQDAMRFSKEQMGADFLTAVNGVLQRMKAS